MWLGQSRPVKDQIHGTAHRGPLEGEILLQKRLKKCPWVLPLPHLAACLGSQPLILTMPGSQLISVEPVKVTPVRRPLFNTSAFQWGRRQP